MATTEPAAKKAKKGLVLYTANTPNGIKVSAFLEELKAAYGSKNNFDFEYVSIELMKGTQKEQWFTDINPNGRIPALVDHNRDGFKVFESAAILLYLEKHYDPDHIFSWPSTDPKADDLRSQVLQWMFFGHGGVGPMQGQANHFRRYAPETIEYGIKRYTLETKRLYGVLDKQLQGREWLVGDKLTLADFSIIPWVFYAPWSGVTKEEVPATVQAWVQRFFARPAVKEGFKKPRPNNDLSYTVEHMWDDDFENTHAVKIKEQAKEASKWIMNDQKEREQQQK